MPYFPENSRETWKGRLPNYTLNLLIICLFFLNKVRVTAKVTATRCSTPRKTGAI